MQLSDAYVSDSYIVAKAEERYTSFRKKDKKIRYTSEKFLDHKYKSEKRSLPRAFTEQKIYMLADHIVCNYIQV